MDPEAAEPEAPIAWPARIVREARSRPFGYGVLAAFVIAGPFAAAWLFPEAPTGIAIVGGALFGGYAALCAVPQKFL